LDLQCIPKVKLGLIGSAYFLGWTIASLIIPRIADIYGRRGVFLSLMTLNFLAVLGSVFSHNVLLTIGCMFLLGIVAVGRWAIGYIMLLEFFPETQKKYLGSVA
jgi:MFS family permease